MGALIKWQDNNVSEEGHRIYKSTSTIDPNNLPSPYATVGPDVTQFEDGEILDGETFYYRIGAYTASSTVELVSDELVVTGSENGPPYLTMALHYTGEKVSGASVEDETGQHDATLSGATVIETPEGRKAFLFNADADALIVDDQDFLDNATEVTVCFFLYFFNTFGDFDVFGKGAHTLNEPLVLWYDKDSTNGDKYNFIVTDSSGNTTGVIITGTTPPVQTRHHLAFVFTAGAQARLYIDGVEDSLSPYDMSLISDISPGGLQGFAKSFVIGNSTSYSKDSNAEIDDPRVYLSALSQAQIQDIYNAGV